MLKSHLAVLLLGMLTGGVSGYIVGHSTQQGLSAEMSSLETELQSISNQLSAFRYSRDRDIPENVESLQTHSVDHEYLMSEINRSVRETVSHAIQEKMQEEFVLLSRRIQGTELAPVAQAVTTYDEGKLGAALEQADAVLGQAISQGIWTQYDKQAFEDATRHLTGNALAEVQRKLVVAINNGDIVLEKGVLPF